MSVTDAYEAGLEYETGVSSRDTVLITRNIDPLWLREKAIPADAPEPWRSRRRKTALVASLELSPEAPVALQSPEPS